MKYIFLSFFLITLSCNQSKKDTKKIKKSDKVTEIKNKVIEKTVVEEDVKTHENLIVTLINPNNSLDAKALVENSSLIWDSLIINKNTTKIAAIKVPVARKDFWIKKLEETNIFSSVELYTKSKIDEIKNLSKNTFVKIRKTQCSGDCPVYELTILKNGTVFFNGLKNVTFLGKQEFVISKKQLQKIKNKFERTSFGMYLDTYVDASLMDYPSTFIVHNDKQIEIKLWKNVPEELAFAFEAVEDILYQKKIIE